MTVVSCLQCRTPIPPGAASCPQCGADAPTSGSYHEVKAADLQERLQASVGDGYIVREMLGQGGMGAVFLAVDKKLDREVAIKVLPVEMARDESLVGRFQHEARTAAKLDHPGIIPIYAVESDDDLHYFVMKFVAGRGLDSLIAAGPLPVDLTQRIIWEAACALGHAHARGVVHRDIKPANIMIEDTGRVVLADFGISKALRSASNFTATGQVIGTPHYMSPEQAKGEEVGGASDQYSLGIVGYRMLAGRLPFEDDSVHTIIYKHVFADPDPIEQVQPGVPQFLAHAIRRALAKEPSHRFACMEDFATAVWPENPVEPETRDSSRISARPVTAIEGPTEVSGPTVVTGTTPRRRVGLVAALGVLSLAAAGTAFAMFTPAGNTLLERFGWRAAPPAVAGPASQPPLALGDTAVGAAQTVPATGGDSASARDTTAAPVEPSPERQQQPAPTRPQPAAQPPAAASRPPARPQVGLLSVAVSGDWMTVWIDGRRIEDTPLYQHELAAGRHVVELRREGYVTVVDTVQIFAGEATTLRKASRRNDQ